LSCIKKTKKDASKLIRPEQSSTLSKRVATIKPLRLLQLSASSLCDKSLNLGNAHAFPIVYTLLLKLSAVYRLITELQIAKMMATTMAAPKLLK